MKRYYQILIAVAIVFLACSHAHATAQFPDKLVYKGVTHALYSNPLESYFSAENPRPRNLFRFSCTACWRGYVATWKIDEGFLYLDRVVDGSCRADASEFPLSAIIPGAVAPVKATWFTGTLRLPQGKMLRYVHMGYGSVYEKEIVLDISSGRVVREEVIDNTAGRVPTEKEKGLEELEKLEKLKKWEEKNKRDSGEK